MHSKLRQQEILFAFCGWLSSRKEKIIFSSAHDAAPIACLIEAFSKENQLDECREGWDNFISYPKEPKKN